MTMAPFDPGSDTFPKLLVGLAKTRAHAPAYREKAFGIWQTYDWRMSRTR